MAKKEQPAPTIHNSEDEARGAVQGKQKVYTSNVSGRQLYIASHTRDAASYALLMQMGVSVEQVRGGKGGGRGTSKNAIARKVLEDLITTVDSTNDQSPFAQKSRADAVAAIKKMDDDARAAAAKRKSKQDGNAAAPAAAPVVAATPAPAAAVPAPAVAAAVPAPAPAPPSPA